MKHTSLDLLKPNFFYKPILRINHFLEGLPRNWLYVLLWTDIIFFPGLIIISLLIVGKSNFRPHVKISIFFIIFCLLIFLLNIFGQLITKNIHNKGK